MSAFKMYPIHSMRKFVCDRLTVAAQEILGAFETRVEDYEAEIARQRRLLDTVFSPEIKTQRTEIPLGEQICQNQHNNSETGSRLVPETIKVKDEHEEMCISEEPLLRPQQQEASVSKLTSVCDPNVSSNKPQPSDPDQQNSVNKDPPSNTSNKDGESGFKRETSAVSTAHSEQPGNLCEAEHQHLTDNNGDASTPGHIDPSPDENEKSSVGSQEEINDENTFCAEGFDEINNENTTVHESSEQFSDSNYNGLPTDVMEPTQREESDELTRIEKHSPETTLAANNEQEQNTMHAMETSTGPKGSERIHDESSDLTGNVEPTQSENSQDGRPVLTANSAPTPNERSPKKSPAASENMEQTPNREHEGWISRGLEPTRKEKSEKDAMSDLWIELTSVKSQDGVPTSAKQDEQKLHNDLNTLLSTEKTPNEESNKDTAMSSKKMDLKPKNKHNDDKTSNRSSVPKTKKKSRDRKASSSDKRPRMKHGPNHRRSDGDRIPTSTCPDDTLDPTWEPNNESPDEISNWKPEDKKAALSLKSTQDEKHDDGNAASARGNESTQHEEVNRENTAGSMETRSPSDGKNTTTSSKPTHKSSGRSTKSRKNKEPTSKKESGARSKKATSLKRLNEGQSSDSAQRKRHKDGHSTSTNEKNELEKTSKGGVTLNEDAEQPPDWSSEGSSGDEKKEDPFKCDTCGKVMSNFKNYKFHMKSHTVEKKFKCDTCGKLFRESWDLNKHLVIHSVVKPYKCDTCGNGFNRRYNLDLHVRVHTGEKPYICSMCGRSFSSCVNLKKHTRIHTGEKPYTCKDCGKEFADSSAFKNHMRVHTGEKPFKCTYCKRKFATRTTLKRHTRTHTGEKPYKCTVCDKTFGHRTDLKGHMRMHTGEKPYKCSTCEDQFSNWSKLNKHKRVHVSEPQSSTD